MNAFIEKREKFSNVIITSTNVSYYGVIKKNKFFFDYNENLRRKRFVYHNDYVIGGAIRLTYLQRELETQKPQNIEKTSLANYLLNKKNICYYQEALEVLSNILSNIDKSTERENLRNVIGPEVSMNLRAIYKAMGEHRSMGLDGRFFFSKKSDYVFEPHKQNVIKKRNYKDNDGDYNVFSFDFYSLFSFFADKIREEEKSYVYNTIKALLNIFKKDRDSFQLFLPSSFDFEDDGNSKISLILDVFYNAKCHKECVIMVSIDMRIYFQNLPEKRKIDTWDIKIAMQFLFNENQVKLICMNHTHLERTHPDHNFILSDNQNRYFEKDYDLDEYVISFLSLSSIFRPEGKINLQAT